MSVLIVQSKLDMYNCKTAQDEENAIREIAQEICLSGLSRAGFFKKAAFQGGTCLRIFYGVGRFSEDLDFCLNKPEKNFSLKHYLDSLCAELKLYGFEFTLAGGHKAGDVVQKGMLKDRAIANVLSFKHFRPGRDTKSIKIKIELDTNPPEGGSVEVKYHDFPFAFETAVHDSASLFAGKCHALLCREYVKGRDWYDFLWYVSRKIRVNFKLLSAALNQTGPWQGQGIKADAKWCGQSLREKIGGINWEDAKKDVRRFLKPEELATLDLWGKEFFTDRAEKMESYLSDIAQE